MQSTKKFIALCNSLPQLVARDSLDYRFSDPVIEVTIAVLKDEDGTTTPRNWSLDYDEPKHSRGGCEARIYGNVSDRKASALFGWHGPTISYGKLRDYVHGARAMKLVEKGIEGERQRASHVRTVDAGEDLRRWLYACGLKGKSAVWCRPEGYTGSGMLTKGQWYQYSVEEFVDLVRTKFPTKVED